MKRFLVILGFVFVIVGFQNCSTDFDPNADWEEITLVYGLLDQDQDSTFLRIQKCFLGKGNLLHFAQEMDSNCYPDGVLDVRIVEWATKASSGALVKNYPTGKELAFQRTVLHTKPEGEFFAPDQPIYFAPSKNWYKDDKIYELVIKNTLSDNVVTAQTLLVNNGIYLQKPELSKGLVFTVDVSTGNEILEFTWETVSRAKIYQPIVRIYYIEEGIHKHADIEMSIIKSTDSRKTLTYRLLKSSFGSKLKALLDNGKSKSLDGITADIFITAATEEFAYYLESIAPLTGIVQERPSYSNINNGLGIFTSRRTKVKFNRELNMGVMGYLRTLNIGF